MAVAIGQTRWAFCQEHSDLVLAEGVSELRTQPMIPYGQVRSSVQGKYLVSLGGRLIDG